jgi:nucleotide-binding universal stress UspA family protein
MRKIARRSGIFRRACGVRAARLNRAAAYEGTEAVSRSWHGGCSAEGKEEGQMARIARIMVPTDFSAPADAALDYARDLARQFGASIDLVHVFDDPFTAVTAVGDGTVLIPVEVRNSLETYAREELRARHAVHADALPGSSHTLLTGSTARRLVEYAEESHPDLIVMSTHGRTGLGHLLLGSVAERVVRTAACPVLTTRQPAAKPAA